MTEIFNDFGLNDDSEVWKELYKNGKRSPVIFPDSLKPVEILRAGDGFYRKTEGFGNYEKNRKGEYVIYGYDYCLKARVRYLILEKLNEC